MSRSILIVDDHAAFRRWARAFLEAEGYRVVGEAADGRTAVEQSARLRPDVVLLDIHLPDVDGFQVARMIGTDASIVLISSRDPEEFGDRIGTSGALGFLAKTDLSRPTLEAIIDGIA